MEKTDFEKLVLIALENLPEKFRSQLKNIDVVVEAKAPSHILRQQGIKSPFQLLGLYQGVPLKSRTHRYANVLPDKISIYQKPIEAICQTPPQLIQKVQEVVIHEIGHHFGLNEEELRKLI